MSEKQYSQSELKAMKKQQLIDIATKLHIPTKGVKKQNLLAAILAPRQLTEAAAAKLPDSDVEVEQPPVSHPVSTKPAVGPNPSLQQPMRPPLMSTAQGPRFISPPKFSSQFMAPPPTVSENWSFQLEMQRIQLERERMDREWQREREREREQREFEREQKQLELEREREQRQLELEREREQRQMELEREQRQQEHELALARERAREREVEQERERQQREHELELEKLRLSHKQPQADQDHHEQRFRVQDAAKLLPKLINEQEIETYIITFEKIAEVNKWPKEHWSAVLQTQLKGKTLKVFAELSTEQCADFEILKERLLTAYELCPEHYRKKFRTLTKSTSESYSEFAFKLTTLFKRWLEGMKSYDKIEELRQVFLMEQFMETVSADMKLWLADKDAKTLDELAKAADKFIALRKNVSRSSEPAPENSAVLSAYKVNKPRSPSLPRRTFDTHKVSTLVKTPQLNPPIRCRYCKKANHTISECNKLKKKKEMEARETTPKEVLLTSNVQIASRPPSPLPVLPVHPLFAPFCKIASIISDDGTSVQIKVLRDTAALQSLLLQSSVPASCYEHTGEIRLLKGVSTQPIEVPLVELHLQTDFINDKVLCGLIQELPEGVDFLLGNDIWFKSHPIPSDVNAVVTRSHTAALRTKQSTSVIPTDTTDQSDNDASPQTLCPTITYGDLDISSVTSL
jgi:predicted transcriptional regulator